jgi:hypothetical protein
MTRVRWSQSALIWSNCKSHRRRQQDVNTETTAFNGMPYNMPHGYVHTNRGETSAVERVSWITSHLSLTTTLSSKLFLIYAETKQTFHKVQHSQNYTHNRTIVAFFSETTFRLGGHWLVKKRCTKWLPLFKSLQWLQLFLFALSFQIQFNKGDYALLVYISIKGQLNEQISPPQWPKSESASNKQWHAAWKTSSKTSADQSKLKSLAV